MRPNAIVYSSAISACGSAGEWRRALDLLDEMISLGISPNTITYNAAIQACERSGVWREAVRLFESMGAAGVERDAISYNCVVRACERGGQFELAYDYMRASSAYATAKGYADDFGEAEGYTAADE